MTTYLNWYLSINDQDRSVVNTCTLYFRMATIAKCDTSNENSDGFTDLIPEKTSTDKAYPTNSNFGKASVDDQSQGTLGFVKESFVPINNKQTNLPNLIPENEVAAEQEQISLTKEMQSNVKDDISRFSMNPENVSDKEKNEPNLNLQNNCHQNNKSCISSLVETSEASGSDLKLNIRQCQPEKEYLFEETGLDIKHVDKKCSLKSNLSEITKDANSCSVLDKWCELCYDETSEKVGVAGFCSDCNSFICHPCLSAHKKSPASRRHTVLLGASMPRSLNDKPIKFQDCHLHMGNLKSKFCLYHGDMICSECIKERHHSCKTTSIYGVCKELGTEEIITFGDTVNAILEETTNAKDALETNITAIDAQKMEMIKDVQSLQDKLTAKVKDMCTAMTAEINSACREEHETLKEKVEMFSDLIDSFPETILSLEKFKDRMIDTNQFIRIQEIVETVRQAKLNFAKIGMNFDKVKLSLAINPDISAFMSDCKGLGNLNKQFEKFEKLTILLPEISFPKTLTQDDLPNAKYEKPGNSETQQMNAKNKVSQCENKRKPALIPNTNTNTTDETPKMYRLEPIPLKLSIDGDEEQCKITGMDVTSNGTLLLSDCKNKAMKIFSSEGQFLSSVLFNELPCGVAVMNDTTAVVSSFKELYILDISIPRFATVLRAVHLGYWAEAVTPSNDSLVVAKWSEPIGVAMIDLEGHELWSVTMNARGENLFGKPFAVAITNMENRTTVVVSDWMTQKIRLLDASNGFLLRTIDVTGKSPHGITVDCDGNIYVCNLRGKEIYVWSSDFQKCRTVLSGCDLPSRPSFIAYSDNLHALFVCSNDFEKAGCVHKINLP